MLYNRLLGYKMTDYQPTLLSGLATGGFQHVSSFHTAATLLSLSAPVNTLNRRMTEYMLFNMAFNIPQSIAFRFMGSTRRIPARRLFAVRPPKTSVDLRLVDVEDVLSDNVLVKCLWEGEAFVAALMRRTVRGPETVPVVGACFR